MTRLAPIRSNARAFVIWRAIEKHGRGTLTLQELASAARIPQRSVDYVIKSRGWSDRLASDIDPHNTRHGDLDRVPVDKLILTHYTPLLGREEDPRYADD